MKAILLAAGNSRRFGGNKLLENFQGRLLYQKVLDVVERMEWEEIILVTQYEEIRRQQEGRAVRVVMNGGPEEGIAGSIRLGVKAAGPCSDYMFFVCDQPYLTEESVRGMREEFGRKAGGIVCAGTEREGGTPNIFSSSFYGELMELQGDRGGRQIMARHPEAVRYYGLSQLERKDFDYKENMQSMSEK